MTRTFFFTILALAAHLLLFGARPARADARHDIVDIRHGRLPVRHELLGWRPDGRAVFQTTACSEGGTTACRADLRVMGTEGAASTTILLDIVEVYCEAGAPCDALPYDVARAFLRAEERAIAAQGPLTRTAPAADAAAALGAVARLGARLVPTLRDEMPGVRTELVAERAGARRRLATLSPFDQRMEHLRLRAAYPSPDRTRTAVVVQLGAGEMCWGPFWDLAIVVVDHAAVGRLLANGV
jgi:hypothetical protein